MLSPETLNRIERLIDVAFAERREPLAQSLSASKHALAARGMLKSSAHGEQTHRIFIRELGLRAEIVLRAMIRAGAGRAHTIHEEPRADMKAFFHNSMQHVVRELGEALRGELAGISALADRLTLDEALEVKLKKHDIEIDLYVDNIETKGQQFAGGQAQRDVRHEYHIYGNVGAVQSGAGSVANIVQSMVDPEKVSLIEALKMVRDAIEAAHELGQKQQQELIEISDECAQIIQSDSPSNSKLRAYFDILAGTVQGLASAQPAYLALQSALAVAGIIV